MKQQIEFDSDGAYPLLDRNATDGDAAVTNEPEEAAADEADTEHRPKPVPPIPFTTNKSRRKPHGSKPLRFKTKATKATTKEAYEDAICPLDQQIDFEDAAAEAEAIVKRAQEHTEEAEAEQLRLGELAWRTKPIHGDRTHWRLAERAGIHVSTLRKRLKTYLAFCAKGAAPPLLPYSVLQELTGHPDRVEIIAKAPRDPKTGQPLLTVRDARKQMALHRAKQNKPADQKTEDEKWFLGVVEATNKIIAESEFATKTLTITRKKELAAVIEPALMETVREGGEALLKLFDVLRELVTEHGV